MKIIVFGSSGQLGISFKKFLNQEDNHEILFLTRKELDICNKELLSKIFHESKPQILINCAAYTDVAKAEIDPLNAELINGRVLENITLECNKHNCVLIHFSTDYVFDGNKKDPYTESDKTNPINQYGKSKLLGEEYIKSFCERFYIIRISWLFSLHSKNFPRTIYKSIMKDEMVNVVSDQIGTPTYSDDVAKAVKKMIAHEAFYNSYGIYHFAGNSQCSWYELATEIESITCPSKQESSLVLPISSSEFKSIVNRPKYSSLDSKKIYNSFGIQPSDWVKGLKSLHENQ